MSVASDAKPSTGAALYVLAAAYFFIGATSLGVIGLVPDMSADLGVGADAIADLLTVFAIVYALAAPGLQAVVGHVPRRWLIAGGLGLAGVSCLMCGLADSYGAVVVSRVLMALGCALIGPTSSAAGASLVAPERRAGALAIVFTGLILSTVLGVPIASYLGQAFGWRVAWLAIGGTALVIVPLVLWLLPADNRGTRATLSAFAGVLADRALALGIATTALQLLAQFVTYALIALWLVEHVGANRETIPLTLLLFGLGGIAGNLIGPVLVGRFGVETTVQTCLAAMAGALGLMWALPVGFAGALGLMVIWSAFGMMMAAPLQSRLVRLAPEMSGLSLALNASAIYVGMSIGSAIAARSLEPLGVGALPGLSALALLGALAVFRASLVR